MNDAGRSPITLASMNLSKRSRILRTPVGLSPAAITGSPMRWYRPEPVALTTFAFDDAVTEVDPDRTRPSWIACCKSMRVDG